MDAHLKRFVPGVAAPPASASALRTSGAQKSQPGGWLSSRLLRGLSNARQNER
jgi:hypothetical protein